jgi:hypothetical protein
MIAQIREKRKAMEAMKNFDYSKHRVSCTSRALSPLVLVLLLELLINDLIAILQWTGTLYL